MNQKLTEKIIIFDTTMRDGELTPGFSMNLQQKMKLAKLLEEIGIDIIEVGYPGMFPKDLVEIQAISQEIKESTICGLAGSKLQEIDTLNMGLKSRANASKLVLTKTLVNASMKESGFIV